MERARFVTYGGVRILLVDLSGIEETARLAREAERVSRLIREQPRDSVLVLADLTGVPYSLRAVRLLGEVAAANAPHVRARAVVGLSDVMRPVVRMFAHFTGRPVEAFDDVESAMAWLAGQAGDPP